MLQYLIVVILFASASTAHRGCRAYAPYSVKTYECLDSLENQVVSKCINESLAPQPSMSFEDFVIKSCPPRELESTIVLKFRECKERYIADHPSYNTNYDNCKQKAFNVGTTDSPNESTDFEPLKRFESNHALHPTAFKRSTKL